MQIKLILFFFVIVNIASFSQNNTIDTFYIYSYELKLSKGIHKNKLFYWIIKNEDLNKRDKKNLKPLYLFNELNELILIDCVNGLPVSISMIHQEGFIPTDKAYSELINNSELQIKSNRNKIMRMKIKYRNQIVKINVYVTTVSGVFCSSPVLLNESNFSNSENISFLVSDFKILYEKGKIKNSNLINLLNFYLLESQYDNR